MAYAFKCDFNLDKCIKALGLEDKGRIQQTVNETFLKGVEPYTPFETGLLKDSARLHSDLRFGKIIWNAENKARRLYYGEEEWNWSNGGVQEGGLRGPYWAERYMQNGGREEIEKAVRKKVREL